MSAGSIQRLLDRAHDAVVSMDQRGLVTYWNPSAQRVFGIGPDAAIGRPVAELIVPPQHREAHNHGLARFLDSGAGPMLDRRVELSALHADGTEFPIEMTITALRDETAGWTFTAFLQDISARDEAAREHQRLVERLQSALALSERRFDAIVGSLPDPVTIRDHQDRIIYANPAALVFLGFESLQTLRATPPSRIMARYVVLDEQGRQVTMDQIPSVRLLHGEASEPLVIRTIDRETRLERWILLKASPLLDPSGSLDATIMVTEDITERKRAEQRDNFMAGAGAVLASSLDYEQTLRNVAELAVPDIVDWCAVDLLDPNGGRRSVAVAHADPERLRLAERLRAYEPARLDPGHGLGLVLRTGEPVLYAEITDQMLAAGAAGQRHLELLRSVGLRSAAIVPMRVGPRTLGAMTLGNAESGRLLDAADVELAELVAARAAVAIENARLFSQRSQVAHTLQQSLLPSRLPEVPGYELASVYIPALESAEVGGDFYDVWETAAGWIMVIGDVTGKGVEAAALTSLVRHTLRALADFVTNPAELLHRLDLTLKKQPVRSFCTAVCLRLDRGRMTLAVGGHPLPICIESSGAHRLGVHGPLLGALKDVHWRDTVIDPAPGGTLVLYTDGVTDAIGAGRERYGPERLEATLDRCRGLPAADVIETLTGALRDFQVGNPADDIAALALRPLAGRTRPEPARGARKATPTTERRAEPVT